MELKLVGTLQSMQVGLLASFVLIACSSTTKSAQESWSEDFCTLLAPCCTKAGRGGDMSRCKASLLSGTGFDETQANTCLADRRAHQNDADFCDTAHLATDACKGIFHATPRAGGKPGDKCASISDCAPDARGIVSCGDGDRSGVCVLRIRGAAGDGPCVGTLMADDSFRFVSGSSSVTTGYVCERSKNLACDDGATQTCTELIAVNKPCVRDEQCVATAYCFADFCAPLHEAGADCFSVRECSEGTRCDEYGSRKCVPLAEAGEPCVRDTQCLSRACANGACASVGSAQGAALYCAN